MQRDGYTPTLVTYNSILNVYGKMGMPWSRVTAIFYSMKTNGVVPDLYIYNTLITCCRQGSLYEEAVNVFDRIKSAGFVPDRVTYNALLDVFAKVRRPKEALQVLKDMESNGFSPNVITYDSLISAHVRGGLLKEVSRLKVQMVEKGPDGFTKISSRII
ncbi:putative pentatricopeptide [Medicago truncatula]|uniref:PPR containing plant-like protein n=1 Tax=Medicago truncatula TaxID=3880 RepID=G7K4R7_MEDTR|nr:PPR containing plant-like protein [Medicago truncatula]RHN58052.1 putative pentatricopeptide [Medicago truncatula]